MDVFAHGLWTNAVFFKKYKIEKRDRFLAILFGVLPDLISFIPSTLVLIFTKENFYSMTTELGRSSFVFNYAVNSYNYTHSIIIFLGVFLIVTIFRKGVIFWPIFGWAFHIFIDIFTHKNFFETPFLFPIFDFRFGDGIPWSNPIFMITNYSILTIIYLIWFLVLRKKKLN